MSMVVVVVVVVVVVLVVVVVVVPLMMSMFSMGSVPILEFSLMHYASLLIDCS